MRSPAGVLITGATGGIGAALAAAYAAPGRTLWLQGRRSEALDELAARCRAQGAIVETRVMELTDTAALLSWLRDIAPRMDLAIVNAGITSDVRIGEDWPEVEHLLQVNVHAAFATVGAVLPAMRSRGRGQIALVSSVAAWFGMPLTPAYSASKAALKAYGEALRGWLAPEGVEVNVVMPGFVKSAMSARFPGPKRFMLEPEAAARRIVAGLKRNEARISFPFAPSLFMWALGAMPAALAQRLIAALGYGR
jgi:short-subunit dehydrogenase